MKYIINTDALHGGDITKAKSMLLMGTNGKGEVIVQKFNLDELEELNSDYINEHFGDLQDTAYQRGLEDGKWKSEDGCTGCKYEGKVVTGHPCISCCNSYKNQWTAKSDKIEVGDEIKHKGYKNRFVVTKMQNEYVYGISEDGSWNNFRNDGSFVKTGRHFDIESILEAMKE